MVLAVQIFVLCLVAILGGLEFYNVHRAVRRERQRAITSVSSAIMNFRRAGWYVKVSPTGRSYMAIMHGP